MNSNNNSILQAGIKEFRCPDHPNHFITRAILNADTTDVLFCTKCINDKKLSHRALTLQNYITIVCKLTNTVFSANIPPIKMPTEVAEALDCQKQLMDSFIRHIEAEKLSVAEFYERLKADIISIIEQKKKEAIESLESQIQLLQRNFHRLQRKSKLYFEGTISYPYQNCDDLIEDVNKIETTEELQVFLGNINEQCKDIYACTRNSDIAGSITSLRKSMCSLARSLTLQGTQPTVGLNGLHYDLSFDTKIAASLKRYLEEFNLLKEPILASEYSVTIDSLILDNSNYGGEDFENQKEVRLLSNWIHQHGKVNYTLLYRGSRDGFRAKNFHSLCDGVAPVVVIIETTEGKKFGGFTEVAFHSDKVKPTKIQKSSLPQINSKVTANENRVFLFNLDKREKYPQLPKSTGLMKKTFRKPEELITSDAKSGASFGNGDLRISDKCNESVSYSLLGSTFGRREVSNSRSGPSGIGGTLSFLVKEIEVFFVEYDKAFAVNDYE